MASKSAFFLQIFAIGSFLNFMMHIPYVALQGIGLSKLLAKIHVTELILYLPILYYFISSFGLNGAILAWATRMIIDAILKINSEHLFSTTERAEGSTARISSPHPPTAVP